MKKYAIALLILCFAALVCMPVSSAADDGDDDYYDHIYAPPTTEEKEVFQWFPWESTDTAVTLYWHFDTGNDKTKGYLEIKDPKDGNEWKKLSGTDYPNNGNIKIEGLRPKTKYSFRWHFTYIEFSGEKYEDVNELEIRATTKPRKTKIVSCKASKNVVRINWKRVGCGGYKVQVFDKKTKAWKTAKTVYSEKETTAKIAKLKSGSTYRFRVTPFTKNTSRWWSPRAKWNEKKQRYDVYRTVWGKPSKVVTVKTKK